MPSPLRYIPNEAKRWTDSQGRRYAIVEITIRCLQGRSLLRPSDKANSLMLGVLGRAQAMLDFPLFGYAYLSNHGSILVGVRSAEHQAGIMEFIHGNIARELGRKELSDWSGKFWERRGRPILVWDDDAVEARLKYLLSNSTKENLVKRPTRWPGVHCARALSNGTTDTGLWIDRTELSRLRRKRKPGERVSEAPAITHYDVQLSKIPSRATMTDPEYQDYIKGVCREISDEAAEKRGDGSVLGVNAIMRVHPHHRPEDLSHSPAPLVHCSDKEQRSRFREAYRAFVAAYREAFASLRHGITGLGFPQGGIAPGCRFCPEMVPDTG